MDKKSEPVYRQPQRIFENSGLFDPKTSYYVPLENVTNKQKQDIKTMIDKGRYFSIFAPRQSGKTTFIKRICDSLHKDSTYIAIMLSFQKYKNLEKSQFYAEIERKLYSQLLTRLKQVKCDKTGIIEKLFQEQRLIDHLSFSFLFEQLNQVIEFKKIVVFIDEFDGIPEKELENFLTALRDLYQDYKEVEQKALYSVGLAGIRNITKLVVGGVSPFNIADQVELTPFSINNIRDLYNQYTEETNQPFTREAVQKIYEETSGQPWLVNRLGTILTVDIKPGTVQPIDLEDVEKAIVLLLRERNDHFENLYEKAEQYKETFIQVVFDHVKYIPSHRELSWLEHHGLIKDDNRKAVVANPIYKARFVEAFFDEVNIAGYQDISLARYRLPLPGDGLDMQQVFLDFNRYIAQIGVNAFYQEKKPYEKTGKFLLTAWLYQFVRSSDGQSELRYEVPTGMGRMDILLTYKGKKYIIELKVNRASTTDDILEDGIEQLSGKYLATEGVDEGYLVVFDTGKAVGTKCKIQEHPVQPTRDEEQKATVTSIIINIGKPA